MASKSIFGPNDATIRTGQLFKSWNIIRPDLESPDGPWGWIHYGIYIPQLPPPFQYLNVVITVGTMDLAIWNHAEYVSGKMAVVQNPKNLTTIMTSTAANGHHFVRGYNSSKDCELSGSGTPLRWGGDEFRMDFAFPHKSTVSGNFVKEGWDYKLELDLAPNAIWFIATSFYEHFSLPFSGRATISGKTMDILGCLEYARCKPAPGIPLEIHDQVAKSTDYFIYHVVQLDGGKQILWGEVRNHFIPPRKFLYVRTVDGVLLEIYTTELEIEVMSDEITRDSLGRDTRMPKKFRARVVSSEKVVLEIIGTVNTPLRDGAGRGYVGGYSAVVKQRGEESTGQGMFEWVDLELHNNQRAAL